MKKQKEMENLIYDFTEDNPGKGLQSEFKSCRGGKQQSFTDQEFLRDLRRIL